jgi:hypothetical protein
LRKVLEARDALPESFPFLLLPTEIRLLIWRMCLPSRVLYLEMDESMWCHTYEDIGHFVNRLKPPRISRVCREARGVAFDTGGFQTEESVEVLSRNSEDPHHLANLSPCSTTWFDPTTDILHISNHFIPGQSEYHGARYVFDFGPFCRATLAVSMDMSLWEIYPQPSYKFLFDDAKWRRLRTIYVTHSFLSVHLARGCALDIELFGDVAEDNNVCIVDSRNKTRLERILNICRTDLKHSAAGVFDSIVDMMDERDLDDFTFTMESEWIKYCYRKIEESRLRSPGNEGTELGLLAASCLSLSSRDKFRRHESVQKELTKLPEVVRSLVIRRCKW